MQVFGIDFTSAPSFAKPITCARGDLRQKKLQITDIESWDSFDEFESFLAADLSAITGIDFPFGQPARLIKALDWPPAWSDYVRMIGKRSKTEFVETLETYCRGQPKGDKHHFRVTDRSMQACSPMMIYGVPVAKMFYEGAPRLAESPVSVLPCRPRQSPHVVVEVYPSRIARRLLGKRPYKNDTAQNRAQRIANRRRLLEACTHGECPSSYPIRVTLSAGLAQQIIDQASGDGLDAVLAALQVASAYRVHGPGLGIPATAVSSEGWIVDTDCRD